MVTRDSTLFTFCPPGPPLRDVAARSSWAGTMIPLPRSRSRIRMGNHDRAEDRTLRDPLEQRERTAVRARAARRVDARPHRERARGLQRSATVPAMRGAVRV